MPDDDKKTTILKKKEIKNNCSEPLYLHNEKRKRQCTNTKRNTGIDEGIGKDLM
jgi:hypothetical protein